MLDKYNEEIPSFLFGIKKRAIEVNEKQSVFA